MPRARGRKPATKREPKPIGRPTVLDDALRTRIVELVSRGVYLSHVAGLVRVDRRTLQRWKSQGADDLAAGADTQYARLSVELEEAKSRAAADATRSILDHGKRDWRALAWYLERVHPDHFGTPRENTVRPGHMLDVEAADLAAVSHLSDGELDLVERQLSQARAVIESAKTRRSG